MAGVFGIVGQPGVPGLRGRLSAMAAQLRHHYWYQESVKFDEVNGVGLGRVSLGSTTGVPQGDLIGNQVSFAFLEGEILDYAEHRRSLEAIGQRFLGVGPAELIARGIAADGPAFCRRLNGKFAAAVWDAGTRRLVLVNDRFGMKPLYYVRLPGRLLFASEIKALFAEPAVSRRADLRGVAQFFTFGQLLGEGTMFDGVRLLPAAGVLVYEPDGDRLTLDRYWRLQSRSTARSTAETLDRIDHAFGQAVERLYRRYGRPRAVFVRRHGCTDNPRGRGPPGPPALDAQPRYGRQHGPPQCCRYGAAGRLSAPPSDAWRRVFGPL